MTHTTESILTAAAAALTDVELHAAVVTAREALATAEGPLMTDLFATAVEVMDAEIINRARVALAAFDAAAA